MEKTQIRSLIKLFFCFILFLYLFNCSGTIKTTKYSEPKSQDNISKEDANKMYFSQITDMPLPSKSKIILDNTVIVGKNENWMGRLALTHNDSIDELFTFFVNEMPKFDFEEKSSVRSTESSLIFQNKKKTIFIKISKMNFRKTNIEITSTPMN